MALAASAAAASSAPHAASALALLVPHIAASAPHGIPLLPTDASWLSILQACIPAGIAAIVAWVGYRQLATASAKLKLDLFEKRLAIFDATWEAISNATASKFVQPNDLVPFHNKIPEAGFLFGPDIESYMQRVRHQIATQQLGLLQLSKEGHYASQELRDQLKALSEWFTAETEGVQTKFKPYLSFHTWR